MPSFDLNYLPPSISVNVTSMLDDVAAFAVMADTVQSPRWNLTLALKLAYILPYAAYHEVAFRKIYSPCVGSTAAHFVRIT
jgi:hypothetical protein